VPQGRSQPAGVTNIMSLSTAIARVARVERAARLPFLLPAVADGSGTVIDARQRVLSWFNRYLQLRQPGQPPPDSALPP
jgi:hypothetical protein